ncbi:hypothetical protein [Peribacillus frigoritolerans]|uniref:hypothetical protein n=1 Tax=Peribacillus frigoritolerans TaxID=450367 RepID=UPI0039A1FF74
MENTKILEKVSPMNRERYEYIWIPSFQESNIPLECLLDRMDEYIVKKDKQDIGSLAFIDYGLDSGLNEIYNFLDIDFIRYNWKDVTEIDYISVSKVHRSDESLERLLYSIYYYLLTTNKKYGVMLFNPSFYFLLKRIYKFPLTRVDNKEKVTHNKWESIACYLSVEELVHKVANEEKMQFFFSLGKEFHPELLDVLFPVKELAVSFNS